MMTFTLVRKLFRDVRLGLFVVALLLFLFQLLWCKVTQRIVTAILPTLSGFIDLALLRSVLFQGPGQMIQTLMGGENIRIDRALDMVSIAYVHPLTQAILCVWAIGRAAGAIAGEIDKGTMELLLAQPIRRGQIIGAHLLVEAIAVPMLCLAMWGGTWVGTWLVGFHTAQQAAYHVEPGRFLLALPHIALMVFAVSGVTMAFSSAGRFRGRVLGLAVLVALVQFLINVIGQLWDTAEPLRPFTIFYYYQPQGVIVGDPPVVWSLVWRRLVTLAAIGSIGYLTAWQIFRRRDLPAPL